MVFEYFKISIKIHQFEIQIVRKKKGFEAVFERNNNKARPSVT